ncbi:hypothetical protein [Kordiimonas pumila]|uniref:Sulfotransferase family protein n=1 Tax=Kordiimonas pumila TaxID=2161677 RepID=A0ABV7D5Q9_9PROT|nr:hypothetical protein [Kordiimonas pumila]
MPFLRLKVGDEIDSYDVYSLFREPAEWMYSWYRFRNRHEISPEVQPDHWEYAGHLTWQQYLLDAMQPNPPKYASVGRQCDFVTGMDGTRKGLHLIRYEDLDAFLLNIQNKMGQELKLRRLNVSPEKTSELTDVDIRYCRSVLVQDYEIYDNIAAL